MSRLQLTSIRPLDFSPQDHFSAIMQPQGLPVTIKRTFFNKYTEANSAIREAVILAGLRHEGIVTVYDCYIDKEEQGFTLNLVTEAVEKSLQFEIEDRARAGRMWSEGELWQLFYTLISALAYAQSRHTSHRNLTPSSIFFTAQGIKLAQFSMSVRNLDMVSLRSSIIGDAFYFSPELKQAFLDLYSGQTTEEFTNDPVKSDVYTLAVTMIYAANLSKPVSLSRLVQLDRTIEGLLTEIGTNYPTIKWYLAWMLALQPENRPTFTEIWTHIQQWQSQFSST